MARNHRSIAFRRQRSITLRHRLRTILCCAILEAGALFGIPMRPEQIRELMETLNKPKIAQTTPERTADGDQRRD